MLILKRINICIVFLSAIFLICIWSPIYINRCNQQLFSLIDAAEQAYKNQGDTAAAVEKIVDYWEDYYVKCSYLVRTDSLNSLSSDVYKLKFLLESDCDEFTAELENIRTQTDIYYKNQLPKLYNILCSSN